MAIIVNPVYPGHMLTLGSNSSEVARMQKYLNTIRAMKYHGLNLLTVDGAFGNATKTTVEQYQAYALLHIDGEIGPATWNSIVSDYNSLVGGSADTYPGIPLRPGSTSSDVAHMQTLLNSISPPYTAINRQNVDGSYGTNMTSAVRRFQRLFSLNIDGIIGPATWAAIVTVKNANTTPNRVHVTAPFSGVNLNLGSTGDSVRCVQSFLNATNGGKWGPLLTIDGNYGSKTQTSVIAFQAFYGLKPDGIVGSSTWNKMVQEFNNTL